MAIPPLLDCTGPVFVCSVVGIAVVIFGIAWFEESAVACAIMILLGTIPLMFLVGPPLSMFIGSTVYIAWLLWVGKMQPKMCG